MLDRKESARQSLEKRTQVSENFIRNAAPFIRDAGSFIRDAARHVATKTMQARSVGLFVDSRVI